MQPIEHDPLSAEFITLLQQRAQHPYKLVRTLFDPETPITVARAPGRLDLMGGIADYSGSLVLQWPLREAAHVGLQKSAESTLRIVTLNPARNESDAACQIQFSSLLNATYAQARDTFRQMPTINWAAYIAGVFLVLATEENVRFTGGANLLIDSTVPEGKGGSSSAALEVAVMRAVCAAYGIEISAERQAILCQMVENYVVGAPCGIMDQMSVMLGQENRLLALLCQPAIVQGTLPLPDGLAVWGIDSGIRHAVSGADYGSVRVGAFMGFRIIRELTERDWGGYLANVPPSYFEQHLRDQIPVTMLGAHFLAQYGETGDRVTTVDPDQWYAVRQPTAHPIYEHFRVQTFAQLLAGDPHQNGPLCNGPLHNGPLLGELMFQSHASYSACGLGSEGTDRLVALARAAGVARGIYGAKITGGGSGGTVAILGRQGEDEVVREIAERYSAETGRPTYVFSGSSSGSAHAVICSV